MERAFLEEQLAAGRSLEQIGAMVGKHPSTVGYWLKKHGLRAVNHDKNAPTRRVDPTAFIALVGRGLTRVELQRELGISGATVTYWLRKLGLTTRRGDLIKRNTAARAAGTRTVRRHCRR